MSIVLLIIALIAGFSILIWSAAELVTNGVKIASIFNISPLVIGLIVLGFGTSMPEMFVSAMAAIDHNTDISIGNAMGSNILNISLVLGVSAVIVPIKVSPAVLKKEWVFLIAATLVTGLLLSDGYLGFIDGIILISILFLFLIFTFLQTQNKKPSQLEYKSKKTDNIKIYLMLLVSLIILICSAKLIVWSGVGIAKIFGLSDLIIGLTVIALGTSLPELAVSIASIFKKQHEIIIGNIIGSNLFNTVGVLALPGLIYPNDFPSQVFNRDYVVVLILTVLLFVLCYRFDKNHTINRFGGVLLLMVFGYYTWQLF